jgi:hypothetical protein
LKRFASDVKIARGKYRDFLAEGLAGNMADDVLNSVRKSNKGAVDIHDNTCWVIGDRDFVQKVILADKEKRIALRRYQREGWDVPRLAAFVAKTMKVPFEKILYSSKRTRQAEARKVFCFLGYRNLGLSARQLGEYLNISSSAVTFAAKQGESIAKAAEINI